MNPTYFCKINSPFKRDGDGRFTGEWADPRFADLAGHKWWWRYKLDGTSVGCYVTSHGDVRVFGRGTKTVMPGWQAEAVQAWADGLALTVPDLHVYGELVGPKVQGNPHDLDALQVFEFARGFPGKMPWPTGIPAVIYEPHTLANVIDRFHRGGSHPCRGDGYYEGAVGWHKASGLWTKLKIKDKWADTP